MVVRSKINQRLNGQNPLAYIGVAAGQPTDLVTKPRDPLTSDYQGYQLGCWWLNIATNDMWYLVSLSSRSATWIKIGGTGNQLLTLTGDTGGAVSGDALKNINIISAFAGITIDGNPGTNTLTLNSSGAIGLQFNTDSGNAIPAANILEILGGLNIETTGSGNTVTVKMIQLSEGVVYPDGSGVFTSLGTATDGEILIGSTGSVPAWAHITSSGGTVSITEGPSTINLEVPSGPVGSTTAFAASKSAFSNNVTGDGTQYFYIADIEWFDVGGDYDPTTGIFTAPSDGYYFFGACPYATGLTGATNISFVVGLVSSTGATYQLTRILGLASSTATVAGGVTIVPMTMGETIKPYLTVSNITKVVDVGGNPPTSGPLTRFFGYRLPT